jgi:hypothetical protein
MRFMAIRLAMTSSAVIKKSAQQHSRTTAVGALADV